MLIELFTIYKEASVNHLFFALFDSKRPSDEVIQELGEEAVRSFPER